MIVDSATQGFSAKVYATNTKPNPDSFTASGWQPVSSATKIGATQSIPLTTGGKHYRYYLFWITTLPAGSDYISVNEIRLYQ
jgi:hypothetical protein